MSEWTRSILCIALCNKIHDRFRVANLFGSLYDAGAPIEDSETAHDTQRPHMAPGMTLPA
ncbi:MAG: hypothetical protein ACI8X5_004128 [Planctomycetota bacterium]|jgi:hypothetical protein